MIPLYLILEGGLNLDAQFVMQEPLEPLGPHYRLQIYEKNPSVSLVSCWNTEEENHVKKVI